MTTPPPSYSDLMAKKDDIEDFLERVEETNKKVCAQSRLIVFLDQGYHRWKN